MTNKSLFISAGDPSGDNAAALFLSELFKLREDISCFGLGGPGLERLGQRQLANGSNLAVLGFWEVAKRINYFKRLMDKTVAEINSHRPACLILVDYPGFNLRLAARVKKFGIPIIYYISPQVWAWGKKRIKQIQSLVDLMIPILPFEESFFKGYGVNTSFVGHYLLDDIPSHMINSSVPGQKKIALLPGSRAQEIERMLPAMLKAAALINKRHNTTAVVAGRTSVYDYEKAIKSYGDKSTQVIYDQPRDVIADSDVAITASGTATLETAIISRPMVVVYKTGWITYQIARRLVKLDKIALANLVLGEKVVPELIQNEMTPENIAREAEKYLLDSEYSNMTSQKLSSTVELLGGTGASTRVAKLIAEYL